MAAVVRRRPPGKNGGRPVHRDFYFVKADGALYPSESEAIRTGRERKDPNQKPSWTWALNHTSLNDLWLVVPIDQKKDLRAEINKARAAIWRTALRRGMSVTSQYEKPNLYIKVLDK